MKETLLLIAAAVLAIAGFFLIVAIRVKGLHLTEGEMLLEFWPLWSAVLVIYGLAFLILRA